MRDAAFILLYFADIVEKCGGIDQIPADPKFLFQVHDIGNPGNVQKMADLMAAEKSGPLKFLKPLAG